MPSNVVAIGTMGLTLVYLRWIWTIRLRIRTVTLAFGVLGTF